MSKPYNQFKIFLHYWLVMLIVFWVLVSCTGGDNKNPPNPKPSTGGPSFVINSPKDGSSIAGTIYFSAQPFDATEVASVNFKAGNTDLGTDTTASDGFKVFLDSKDFPEGTLNLTAALKGKNGKSSTQNISVTNKPSPPSQATVTNEGAALGTTEASGALSTLSIPSGATVGSNVKFEAKTKEEVKAATGVDYDALGVTFLGAQEISASKPLETPVAVTSGGFGPMVQPDQVVVNYMIAPDADDDGVGELMVINTASVSPSGDVISDPVPPIQLGAAKVTTSSGTDTLRTLQAGTISGPPGTFIEIEAPTGFNPLSVLGNTATFESLVDGKIIELPTLLNGHFEDQNGVPTIGIYIPVLPAGPATLTLTSVSSNEISSPIDINIETAPDLIKGPAVIIDETLAKMVAVLETEPDVKEAVDNLKDMRASFTELSNSSMPDVEKALKDIAVFLSNSNIDDILNKISTSSNLNTLQCSIPLLLNYSYLAQAGYMAMALATLMGIIALALTGPLFLLTAAITGLAFGTGFTLFAGGIAGSALEVYRCVPQPPPGSTCLPPYKSTDLAPFLPPSTPVPSPESIFTQQTSSSGMTGMGSASPQGGDGCGSAVGGSGGSTGNSLQAQQTGIDIFTGDLTGRFVVKVFYGNGNSVPFTGISDSSGYFYIPLIPADQPYEAIAIDQLTGETRSFKGTGPQVGFSTFMSFDFLNDEDSGANTISYNTNTENSFGDVDLYFFEGKVGDLVKISIFIKGSSSGSVRYEIADPSGQILASILSSGGNVNIPLLEPQADGFHSLTIYSNEASGDYTLGLAEIEAPVTINAGTSVMGNIETFGDRQYYKISGSQGQTLNVSLSHDATSTLNAELNIRRPAQPGRKFYEGSIFIRLVTDDAKRSRTGSRVLTEDYDFIVEVLPGDRTATELNKHLGSYSIDLSLDTP